MSTHGVDPMTSHTTDISRTLKTQLTSLMSTHGVDPVTYHTTHISRTLKTQLTSLMSTHGVDPVTSHTTDTSRTLKTQLTCTGRPSHSMDVILLTIRHIVVDDEVNSWDIQTSANILVFTHFKKERSNVLIC